MEKKNLKEKKKKKERQKLNGHLNNYATQS